MASYVPIYEKKRSRRAWREERLIRSIERNESHDRHLVLAEELRLGMIREIRAERALIMPRTQHANKRFQRLDERIRFLEKTSPEEMLEQFVAGRNAQQKT